MRDDRPRVGRLCSDGLTKSTRPCSKPVSAIEHERRLGWPLAGL